MGKNDDFAARHARISDQQGAADRTRGMTTDPRRAKTPARDTGEMRALPAFVEAGIIREGLVALELGAFAICQRLRLFQSARHRP